MKLKQHASDANHQQDSNLKQEANTFVNKGSSENNEATLSSKQVLMMVVENNDDFGQEIDNYFQICEIVNNKSTNTSTIAAAQCHMQYSGSDTSVYSSTSTSQTNATDDNDNWEYWAN